MKAISLLLITFALGVSASCQTTTGSATTTGSCSPAVTGNNNTILIRDCGISKKQADKIVALLRATLVGRDIASINAKLDELLKVASQPSQTMTMNCSGGNCLQGNPQPGSTVSQNMYGVPQPPPEPVHLTYSDLAPASAGNTSEGDSPLRLNPGVVANFTIDKSTPNPMFIVFCGRPCVITSAATDGANGPPQIYTFADNPNAGAVRINPVGGIVAEGAPVWIDVRSLDNQKISINAVKGYVMPLGH